jgi:hypothetical protein
MIHTSFSDVTKAFRRGAHVHAHHWRAIVLCPTLYQLEHAWDEALATMNGSSFAKGLTTNITNRTMEMNNGAILRFALVDPMNAEDDIQLRLAGNDFTHLIWFGPWSEKAVHFAEPYKRSRVVPPEEMKTHFTSF